MAYSTPFSQSSFSSSSFSPSSFSPSSMSSMSSMYLKSGGGMPYHMGLGPLGMGLDPMHAVQYSNQSKNCKQKQVKSTKNWIDFLYTRFSAWKEAETGKNNIYKTTIRCSGNTFSKNKVKFQIFTIKSKCSIKILLKHLWLLFINHITCLVTH